MEPCIYVDEGDVDVILPSLPSTCSAHIEYLGSVARTGDVDAAVGAPGIYGFSVFGGEHAALVPVATDLASFGAEVTLAAERIHGGWGLVVAPPDVTKWSGVVAYCKDRGIQPGEVLAVGDGDNDVDMLVHAGIAVAVRTGTERAVTAARHLIDPPETGGWAAILDLAASDAGRATTRP